MKAIEKFHKAKGKIEAAKTEARDTVLSCLSSFAVSRGYSSIVLCGRCHVLCDDRDVVCPFFLEEYFELFQDDRIVGKRWESGKGWS